MRKTVLAATVLGALGAALGAAATAHAGPGQCYDAYGRPIGPVYDTDHPNYAFLDSVVRRGGTCTGMNNPPARRGYQPNYGYDGYRRDGNYYRGNDYYRRDPDRGRYSREQRRALKPDINGNLPPVELPDRSR